MSVSLERAKVVWDETISAIGKIEEKVDSNTRAIDQLSKIIPAATMLSSNLTHDMINEAEMLKRMTRECSKNRASPEDYADLLKIEQIRGLRASETHVESIHKEATGLIIIDLHYSLNSKDTKVYEVLPLRHWVNVTTHLTLVECGGPKWVVFNSTSQCIQGIERPNDEPVYMHCQQPNYKDPRLDIWIPVNEHREDYEQLSRPQVYKTATESVISCLFHQIRLADKTYDCPYFPFSLPLSVPYRLVNQVHEVKVEHIRVADMNINYRTPHFEVHSGEKYSPLIRSLHQINKESLTAGRFNIEKDTLTIPLDARGIILITTLLGSILTIVSCIIRLRQRCQNDATQRLGEEQINVITSPPPSSPQPPTMSPMSVPPIAMYPQMVPVSYLCWVNGCTNKVTHTPHYTRTCRQTNTSEFSREHV